MPADRNQQEVITPDSTLEREPWLTELQPDLTNSYHRLPRAASFLGFEMKLVAQCKNCQQRKQPQ